MAAQQHFVNVMAKMFSEDLFFQILEYLTSKKDHLWRKMKMHFEFVSLVEKSFRSKLESKIKTAVTISAGRNSDWRVWGEIGTAMRGWVRKIGVINFDF